MKYKCKQCGEEKELNDYYQHKRTNKKGELKIKRHTTCIKCTLANKIKKQRENGVKERTNHINKFEFECIIEKALNRKISISKALEFKKAFFVKKRIENRVVI